MACIIIWENGPNLKVLQHALGDACVPIPIDVTSISDTFVDKLWAEDARLLVHVNLAPRRSQRQGFEMVKQLRLEWGVTAPVLFLSFEAEKILRATPHGDLLKDQGHGFLRLPATVETILDALYAVSPVAEPERYQRSAAATALGLLLDGPAADPINDGPGPTVTLLNFWQNGALERAEVAKYLTSNPWWRQWATALTDCRKRLTRLVAVPVECFEYLKQVEESLATVTAFAEQAFNLTQEAPMPQSLTAVIDAAEVLINAVEYLAEIRRGLKGEKEANRV